MKITIIGSGTVGCATGKGFLRFGHDVMFYDIDRSRAESLVREGLSATTDISLAAGHSSVFFICVPTPTKNGGIDLSFIKSAAEGISKAAASKKEYFTVAVKSTVVPTTTESIIVPLLEKHSGKKAGKDFGVCFNPEFLREKYAYEDFVKPDRIVIGQHDKTSGDLIEELYRPFGAQIIRTDLRTAEIIKYANNCFYATKISFFNEMHLVCEKLGIDSNLVRRAVQMDRFYPTHPWFHGSYFDGKCIPKDLSAFIRFCSDNDIQDTVLLDAVWEVNEQIRKLKTGDVVAATQVSGNA